MLGYGYIWNTHVVDLIRETLAFRKKAWLEFIGLTCFMIPYSDRDLVRMDLRIRSWAIGEISASQVGLPHRWIIKSISCSAW